MVNTQTSSKTPKLKLDFKDSKYATGRRKTSIAKVWIKKGSGKIYVNGKLFSEQGIQVAAGVPLECDEGNNFMTFRIGLFGLDKLHNRSRTVKYLEKALNAIVKKQKAQ